MKDHMSDFQEYCRICEAKVVWWYPVPAECIAWVVSRDDLDEQEKAFFTRYIKQLSAMDEVKFRLNPGVD